MSNEIYIAKQETLLETKTKVETVQNTLVETETKVEAVQNKLSETETKVEAVQNTLGKTNDSGGTTTTGTVAAKENAILTEVNKIGNIADTGGSATAGTVMGKLNNIIGGKKYKSFKRVTVSLPADATNFILLSVSGAGEFYGVWTTCKILRVSVDGGLTMSTAGSTSTYAFTPYIVNGLVGRTTSSSGPDLIPPMPFKDSLIITANAQSTGYGAIIVYALYE